MTEDEQLQAAMRASMQDATSAVESVTAAAAEDDDDDVVEIIEGSQMDISDDSKPPAKKSTSWIDDLLALPVVAEPSAGSRLAFRMPDGKRVLRKFSPSDTVKAVYAFVAVGVAIGVCSDHTCPCSVSHAFTCHLSCSWHQQTSDEARGGREFTLMAGFPPEDLIFELNKSVGDCKLSGQQITVRWKE
jgi:hypothetical protein